MALPLTFRLMLMLMLRLRLIVRLRLVLMLTLMVGRLGVCLRVGVLPVHIAGYVDTCPL